MSAVADTNAVLWYVHDPRRLSSRAKAELISAVHIGRIYISAITLVELVYLTGKPSFAYPNALAAVVALVTDPAEPLEVLPVTLDVALAVERIPKVEVPEMGDRIIAATAVAHGLPLVSADSEIRSSAALAAIVPVIW